MTAEPAAERQLNRRRFSPDAVQAASGDAAASQALFAWYAPGFSDRLGDRLNLFDNTDGPPLELLRLRPEFSRAPDFEFSLRARVAELRDFDHPRYARVYRSDRLPDPGGGLALVCARSEGMRLSDLLRLAERRGARLSAELLLPLVADATDALAALHAQGSRVVHGALGTDRVIVGPGGRLLVAEYVLGSALRGLPYSRADFWRVLRVALPADTEAPAFDQRADVLQLGLVALSLVLTRVIDGDEDLARLGDLLHEAGHRVAGAGWDGRWPAFTNWLARAIGLESGGFADAWEAGSALAQIVPLEVRRPSSARGAAAWDQFVANCEAPPILTGSRGSHANALGPGSAPRSETGPAAPDERDALGADALDGWERPTTPPPVPSADQEPPRSTPQAAPSEPAERRDWRAPRRAAARGTWRLRPTAAAAVLALAMLGGGVFIGARFFSTPAQRSQSGSVYVVSNPPGATVTVNGKAAGATPLTLTLTPGRHVLELVAGTRRRVIPVSLAAGARVSQFIDLPAPPSATGQLRVTTQPDGLTVLVDGAHRGSSPLVVADLAVGPHLVTVEGRGRTARQSVEIEGGATASLFVPLSGGGTPAPGWLTVAGEVELQVMENGELLGTSRSARIMLAAGRHEIDLVNDELGVRSSEEVQIPAGGTASVEVELPRGRLDVNALPWAEVWLDGERIGETPLGGISTRVGRHTVTFKNPELGERQVECTVATGRSTRVGVDLRK